MPIKSANSPKEISVLTQLAKLVDPEQEKDIVTLGYISSLEVNSSLVSIGLELPLHALQARDKLSQFVEDVVKELDWVDQVDVSVMAKKAQSATVAQGDGLKDVNAVVAVASCKGGVGKSTTAVNLAFSLALSGSKVGIFDADIYGPSLPTMVKVDTPILESSDGGIKPVMSSGVKMMSFGYTQESNGEFGPAVLRGAMVTQIINQMLTQTDWGELDYLIVDMPPGTGDIQITLAQVLSITASVMVTTPQEISFVDVIKGVQMFDSLNIPTIAAVENMSYFLCDNCHKRHKIFGKGVLDKLLNEFGFPHAFEFPVEEQVSKDGDSGIPLVIQHPDSVTATLFDELASSVKDEVANVQAGIGSLPHVNYDGKTIVVEPRNSAAVEWSSKELRLVCKCAYCVDEYTGEQLVTDSDISDKIAPEAISRVGNYAVGVQWSDGHSSLYPYSTLLKTTKTTSR
jgi:Mrp family chromosome partitioning ATPase/DUF971 family protein